MKILIVEDVAEDCELLLRQLRKSGFDPDWVRVENEQDFVAKLDDKFDLIISDYSLPQFSGMEALRLLQEKGLDVPFILVSGTIGEEIAVEAMRQGAADYLIKDRLARLGQAVTHALNKRVMQQEAARSAEKLRENEERFRQLAENVQEVFWIRNPREGRIEYVSPAFEKVWGRTCSSLMEGAGCWADTLHPDDLERTRKAVHEKQLIGTYDEQYRILRPDRSIRWIRDRAFPVRNAAGEIEKVVGVASDITERVLAQAAAKQSGDLLRAVVEGTTDAVFVKDKLGRYLLINAAAANFIGKSASEIIGKTDAELFDADSANTVALRDHEIMVAGAPETAEEQLTAAGVTRTFLAMKAPYRNDAGEVIGVIGVSRDITKRKQLEQQLHQAQKMEVVGQLAGGVAHDFNNLLTVITGYCDLISAKLPEHDANRLSIDIIHQAGLRAAALTRQLLTFSRQSVIEPRILSLNDIILESQKILGRLIGEDMKIVPQLDEKLYSLSADPGQMNQILMNLVVNARDAMPKGGTISISTANFRIEDAVSKNGQELKPGNYVQLTVADTGVGMPLEIQDKIFEPFFTTKGAGKGTGLGLAVIRGIVDQLAGSIEVESVLGGGSSFKVLLPALTASPTAPSKRDQSEMLHGTETIMLVEDDVYVRTYARIVLNNSGYNVLEASNGKDALEKFRDSRDGVNLLLTDIVMPEMSGRELATELHNQDPHLKTIFISGYTDDAVVRHGVLQSDVAFLQKPFSPEALLRKIREVLS